MAGNKAKKKNKGKKKSKTMTVKKMAGEIQGSMRKIVERLIVNQKLAFDESKEEHAQNVLEELNNTLMYTPDLLSNFLDQLLRSAFLILENPNFQEKTMLLSLELVELIFLQFGERREELVSEVQMIILRIFLMLEEVDDNQKWNWPDKRESETSVFAQGVERLARFAPSMGAQFLLETCSIWIEERFKSERWQERHAVLIFLSVMLKTCCAWELIDMVEPVIEAIEDTHFRVRWAALKAIEMFSNKLSPQFQHQHYQQLLPALTKVLSDFQNPCIQVQASSAMYQFSEGCTSDLLIPYVKEILSELLSCLQRGAQLLVEWALIVLSSLASSLEDHFQEHYSTVMPYLKAIMTKADEECNHVLLAKCLECITVVGLFVGKQKFSDDDIQMVVQWLINWKASKRKTEDPMRIQVLLAWNRICQCLGQDFRPYMQVAIPHMLQSAKHEPHVTTNKISKEKESFQSILTLEDQSIETKTDDLDEKLTACQVLTFCVDELKEEFFLWTDEVAQILVPLLNYEHYDEIKKVAISAMPALLRSSKAAVEKGCPVDYQASAFKKLCSYIIAALVEALEKDEDYENSADIFISLNKCMQISEPILNEEQIKRFLDRTLNMLKFSFEVLRSGVENKIYQILRDQAGDCLITFIIAYKASLSQSIDQLLTFMPFMWAQDTREEERRTALRIFSTVAVQCGEEAFKNHQKSLLLLFDACYDMNPEIEEIAARGIDVSAEFGGSIFKSYIRDALGALKAVLRYPEKPCQDYQLAHDVAVLALGKICLCHYEILNVEKIFSTWISHVPIVHDVATAKVVHDQLLTMLEEFNEELFDKDNINLSNTFQAFAEILASDSLATKETAERVIEKLKQFKSNLPSDTWASTLSSLPPSGQNIIHLRLSTSVDPCDQSEIEQFV